jgi:ribosomal protein S18 acetylase RimI-like enzyme
MADLTLRAARSADLATLLAMVGAYHAEEGLAPVDSLDAVLAPLLSPNSPHGQIFFLDASATTVGYLALTFGYSIELGGRDAYIDELWITPTQRQRGYARAAIDRLLATLQAEGLRAVHLEVAPNNRAANRLYANAGLVPRPFGLLTRGLGAGRGRNQSRLDDVDRA